MSSQNLTEENARNNFSLNGNVTQYKIHVTTGVRKTTIKLCSSQACDGSAEASPACTQEVAGSIPGRVLFFPFFFFFVNEFIFFC